MSAAASGGEVSTRAGLVVVVPARNEISRIAVCLSSLRNQRSEVTVFLSDNASDDGTLEAAVAHSGGLRLSTRTTPPLEPAEHFVSAARWALQAAPEAELFAFLAADDSWDPEFSGATTRTLVMSPAASAAFPSFVWESETGPLRHLPPVSFMSHRAGARQWRGLFLSDGRELSNLVYGVFRRAAFTELVDALERGGDRFAVDYAAAWHVLGAHKVQSAPAATGRRFVRPGADLIERAGFTRSRDEGLARSAVLYIRLNIRTNRLIALALARAVPASQQRSPSPLIVQVARAPQWLWGAVRQVRRG